MNLRKYIISLRRFRVFHRLLGTSLALLLVISAITGVFLALKKNIDLIQPPTQKGQSKDLADWLPLHQLKTLSQKALSDAYPDLANNPVGRMDVRPDKGIVKILFEEGYWEVQLDGKTGAVLNIAKRHSDWIEALHDGSIISDSFKLVSMNFLGWGLLCLIFTGLWLWYGPKLLRKWKKKGAVK